MNLGTTRASLVLYPIYDAYERKLRSRFVQKVVVRGH